MPKMGAALTERPILRGVRDGVRDVAVEFLPEIDRLAKLLENFLRKLFLHERDVESIYSEEFGDRETLTVFVARRVDFPADPILDFTNRIETRFRARA